MRALYRLLDLLFPPKCVLCGRLLDREETDLCGAWLPEWWTPAPSGL